jgi:hypothetical protein
MFDNPGRRLFQPMVHNATERAERSPVERPKSRGKTPVRWLFEETGLQRRHVTQRCGARRFGRHRDCGISGESAGRKIVLDGWPVNA